MKNRWALVYLVFFFAGCTGPVEPLPSSDIVTSVVRAESTWRDDSRVTPEVGDDPGAPYRDLRTVFWIPQPALPTRPMLLLSHGWGGGPDKFEAFASHLAALGVVVVALQYPCTHVSAPGGHEAGVVDAAEQPGDLSFVLDQLLVSRDTSDHPLYQAFEPNFLVGLGHSLGGATMTAATHLACCRDTRIRGVILVAPAAFLNDVVLELGEVDGEGPPTLCVHGVDDEVIALAETESIYGSLAPPKSMVHLKDTDHWTLLESQEEPAVASRTWLQDLVLGFIRSQVDGSWAALSATLLEMEATGHAVWSEGL